MSEISGEKSYSNSKRKYLSGSFHDKMFNLKYTKIIDWFKSSDFDDFVS